MQQFMLLLETYEEERRGEVCKCYKHILQNYTSNFVLKHFYNNSINRLTIKATMCEVTDVKSDKPEL